MPAKYLNLAAIIRSIKNLPPCVLANYSDKFDIVLDFLNNKVSEDLLPEEFSHLNSETSEEEKLFLKEVIGIYKEQLTNKLVETLFITSLPASKEMQAVSLLYGIHLVEGKTNTYVSISKGIFD